MYHAGITEQEHTTGPNLTLMLIMLVIINPFAIQVLRPSMPGLAENFSTSHAAVQLTVSL